ncbi:Lysophospholipid acyltransferase [Oleoguttula sp. CCFEE 5521]
MLPYIDFHQITDEIAAFAYAANALGASTDELKLIFSFLLSYPLAALLKRLPDNNPKLKNCFIIGVSVLYLVGLFDLWAGLALLVTDALAAYLIAAYVEGPYMPWIGFVVLMGHMSVSHIERARAASPSSVDITGAQMVMVMKLTAFCWNVWDGKQDQAGLTDYQRDRALKELPSPLDFAAYVAFFPSLMAGPAFDFADYKRWLETSMFDMPAGSDPAKAPPTRKKRRIPRSGTPAMINLATGVAWILAFLQFDKYFNPAFVLADKFWSYKLVTRIFYIYMINLVMRMKYYGVWTMTEGACIMAGIGYKGVDPKTGKASWDRLTNIKPLGVELAQNSHAYLGNWNINTNNWLRNYMYLRVTPKGKKPGFRATLATFFTSAFWHGFYSGYYLSFLLAAFVQNTSKNARRLLRPFFMTPDGTQALPRKLYYDIFSWVLTQATFSFVTTPFILLTMSSSLRAWSSVYFYPIIGVTLAGAFTASPGKKWIQSKIKARSTRPGMQRVESMDHLAGATLGVPSDPGKEFDEMVDEIVVEVKKRRGSKGVPDVAELRQQVKENLFTKAKSEGGLEGIGIAKTQ